MIIIKDNFYNNVDEVREYALTLDYSVAGNYPGQRTSNHVDAPTEGIEKILPDCFGSITTWYNDSYNGSFQYTLAEDKSWIHTDIHSVWAAVIYLTPNAPLSAGTGFFRHKNTYLRTLSSNNSLNDEMNADSQLLDRWDLADQVANVYNRAVIYPGKYWHSSLDYFGNTINDGRLFQVFFFDTEFPVTLETE